MNPQDDLRRRRGPGVFGWVMLALVVLFIAWVFVGPFFYGGAYPMGMPYYGAYPFGGWFFFPFGFIFFFFIIFFAFRFVFRPWGWGGYGYRGWGHYGDPVDILKRRYARGEITKEQFDQMLRDLAQQK
jgi:putative membrane protein